MHIPNGKKIFMLKIIIHYIALIFMLTSCHQGGEVLTLSDTIPEVPPGGEITVNFTSGLSINHDKPRAVIVSHSTLDVPYVSKYAIPNHQAYAKSIGADYWFRNGTIDNKKFFLEDSVKKIFRYGLYWQKIQAIIDALNMSNDDGSYKYEYVLWIDPDAYFMSKKSIWDIIAEINKDTNIDPSIAIAGDIMQCVNAGVILVRNKPDSKELIRNVALSFNKYRYTDLPEQSSLQDFLYGFASKQSDNSITIKDYDEIYKRKSCIYQKGFFINRSSPYEVIGGNFIRVDPWLLNSWWQMKEDFVRNPDKSLVLYGFIPDFTKSFIIHTPASPTKMKDAEIIKQEILKRHILLY